MSSLMKGHAIMVCIVHSPFDESLQTNLTLYFSHLTTSIFALTKVDARSLNTVAHSILKAKIAWGKGVHRIVTFISHSCSTFGQQ